MPKGASIGIAIGVINIIIDTASINMPKNNINRFKRRIMTTGFFDKENKNIVII